MGGVVGTGAALTIMVGLVIWLLARALRVGNGDKDHPGPDDQDDLDYHLACAILGSTWAVMESTAEEFAELFEESLPESRLRSPEFLVELIIFLVILPLHIAMERGRFSSRWRAGSLMPELSRLYLEALREKLQELGVPESERGTLIAAVPERLDEYDREVAGQNSSWRGALKLGDLAARHCCGSESHSGLGLVVGPYLQTHFLRVGKLLARLEADFEKRGRDALTDPNVQSLVGR